MLFRCTIISDPDDESGSESGSAEFEVPFDDPEIVKEAALEAIGIFCPEFYSIEDAEGSGYVVRDSAGEPFLGIEDGEQIIASAGNDTEDFLFLLDDEE